MASGQWWVISYNPIGNPSTYQYFQGTQAAAQKLADLAIDGSLTGPFTTKAAAQQAVKTGNVTSPHTTVPGSGHRGCTQPTGLNAANPGAWIGYLVCVVRRDARQFFVRSAQVVIGMAMIIVGLNKLTGATGKIEAVAGKIPPVIPV